MTAYLVSCNCSLGCSHAWYKSELRLNSLADVALIEEFHTDVGDAATIHRI